MENEKQKDAVYLSDVIKARHYSQNISLLYGEYSDITSGDQKLTDILYCTIKDIKDRSVITDNKVIICFNFALIILFECENKDNTSEYCIRKDMISKVFDINIKDYDVLSGTLNLEKTKCKNFIKDIKYSTDIDISFKKATVSVEASINSFLIEEDVMKLDSIQLFSSEHAQNNMQSNIVEYKLPDIAPKHDGQNELDTYISNLGSMLKRASELIETNKKLEDETYSKSKKIKFIEYKLRQNQEKAKSLENALKDKESYISILNARLDKSEKKVNILEHANMAVDQELKSLLKENNDLKNYIEEEERKKKKQLNYRIKSVLSNIKIF
ncbi:MAG: hypothetical protein QME45_03545 [Clostridiales bacterium]|nr:hypothetical protein [Clostridiales bacterium]